MHLFQIGREDGNGERKYCLFSPVAISYKIIIIILQEKKPPHISLLGTTNNNNNNYNNHSLLIGCDGNKRGNP